MKKLLLITGLLFTLFLLSKFTVGAQEQYPIAELGNCRDAQECFYYCEIPKNHEACVRYAKSSPRVLGESTDLSRYTFPIADLGNCSSAKECSTFCSKSENKTTCSTWAQKNARTTGSNLAQPSTTPKVSDEKFLQDAKQYLGCDTRVSCEAFCSQDTNKQKCAEFITKERGGTKESGTSQSGRPTISGMPSQGMGVVPLDCTKTENKEKCTAMGASCSMFCMRNPDKCSTTGMKTGGTTNSGGTQQGSGQQGKTGMQTRPQFNQTQGGMPTSGLQGTQ